MSCLIVGAGPVGLRTAIELSLLGVKVQVLERRVGFTRLQVLHLWDWVEADLIDLGIKAIDPSIFASSDFKHVSTCQLQHSLLKVALLLGVRMHFASAVEDVCSLSAHLMAVSERPTHTVSDDVGSAPLQAVAEDGKRGPSKAVRRANGRRNERGTKRRGQKGNVENMPTDLLPRTTGLHNEAQLPDVIVDATGARCSLFKSLGFTHNTVLKSSNALCIVLHLRNQKTAEEMRLQECTWSSQYHHKEFAQLAERGVALQNFVYYRSTGAFSEEATHYFVMTTTMDALVAAGALIVSPAGIQASRGPAQSQAKIARGGSRKSHSKGDDAPSSSVGDSDSGSTCASSGQTLEPWGESMMDRTSLEVFARKAVHVFVPALWRQQLVPNQLALFDFSERKQSNHAALFVGAEALNAHGVGASAGGKDSRSTRILVTRVGDALQEPFWPEGLGINRGFFHALDCADLVQGYAALIHRSHMAAGNGNDMQAAHDQAAHEDGLARLLQRREELFAYTKRVSGANRLTELKPHTDGSKARLSYGIDPQTRYTNLSANIPPQPSFRSDEALLFVV